jgi:ribonuclease R
MKPLPSKDEIRQWISQNPGLSAKRDIAKAFGIKGDGRIELKRLLRELEGEGVVEKTSRRFHEKGVLPPVAVLQVLPPDGNGDLYAKPLEEGVDDSPRILIIRRRAIRPLARATGFWRGWPRSIWTTTPMRRG